MGTALLLMTAILAVGACYVLLPVILDTLRRFRGMKPVVCPETGKAETVQPDAGLAAATSAFGPPKVRMTDCSRWPEHQSCGQECASQIL